MLMSDIILFAVLVLAAYYGWRMGTINVVAKVGAYVLGYRLARYLSPFVAAYATQAFPQLAAISVSPEMDAFFSLFFGSGAAGGFVNRLLEMVAFVVVFTIVCWLVRKAAYALTGIFRRGLLGSLNRALGAFISLLIGFALIVILCDVILPALTGMGMSNAASDFFNESKIVMPLLREIQSVF